MKVASEIIMNCSSVSIYTEEESEKIRTIAELGQNIFERYMFTYFSDNSSINIFKNVDSIDEDNFTKLLERRFITLRQVFTKNPDILGQKFIHFVQSLISCANQVQMPTTSAISAEQERFLLLQVSKANHLIALGTFLIFGHSRLCFHYLDYSFSGFEDFQFAPTSDRLDTGGMQPAVHESLKYIVLSHLFRLHDIRSKLKSYITDQTTFEMTQMCEAYFLGVMCLEGLHNSTILEDTTHPDDPAKPPQISTGLAPLSQLLSQLFPQNPSTPNPPNTSQPFTCFLSCSLQQLLTLAASCPSSRSGLYTLSTTGRVLDGLKQKLGRCCVLLFPGVRELVQGVVGLRDRVLGGGQGNEGSEGRETREFRKGVYRLIGACLFEDEVDDFLPNVVLYGQELFRSVEGGERMRADPKGALLGLFAGLSGMLDAVISPRVAACIVKLFYPRIRKLLDEYGPAVIGSTDFAEGLFEIYKSLNTMLSNHFTSHNILLGLDIIRDECQITIAILSPLMDRFKTMDIKQLILFLRDKSDVISDAFSICVGLLNSQALDVASLGYFGDSLFFSYFQLMYRLAGMLIPLLDVVLFSIVTP